MVLSPRQFAVQMRAKAAAAYDRRAGKFLDAMDQHGAQIRIESERQLANLENLIKKS